MSSPTVRRRVQSLRPASHSLVEIRDVSKTYHTVAGNDVVALKPTRLTIEEGEFIAIVGPSGCGKTTLLNTLAGLLEPSTGEIWFDGAPSKGPNRQIGIVFQRPVLLPWRRVIDNVMLPVEVLGLPDVGVRHKHAMELLKMVGLEGFERSYPKELSGGMQQRAAIARALVYDSRLLLMDEPFAALDAMTREEMNMELLRIWRETKKAVVFITHNIAEAVLLADRIVVMTPRPGQIREVINVDLARPRSLSLMGNSRFGEIVEHIRSSLGKLAEPHSQERTLP